MAAKILRFLIFFSVAIILVLTYLAFKNNKDIRISIPKPVAKAVVKPVLKKDYLDQDKVYLDIVREMMEHSWKGYRKYAWGYDELKPTSNKGYNWLALILLAGMRIHIILLQSTHWILYSSWG